MGIIFPSVTEKNTFVFISADEEGFVFKTGDNHVGNFHSEHASIYQLFGRQRFGDLVSSFQTDRIFKNGDSSMEIILKEGEKPDEFQEIAVSAVTNERNRIMKNKSQRAGARNKMFDRLYGSG